MGAKREFDAQELAAIAACINDERCIAGLARRLNRDYWAIYTKVREFRAAAAARAACGAFLPDNGVPFRAVMQRLWLSELSRVTG